MYPAHPIFDPQGEGLIFTGYKLPGMKLGLNICLNRPTSLFYATELRKDEKAEGKTKVICLTELEYLAIAPRFNEDCTQLVYYASTEEFHQHATCHELKSIEWGEGGPASIGRGQAILEVVEEPDEEYSGLYGFQSDMLAGKFIKGTNLFCYPSTNKGKDMVCTVDIVTKEIKVIFFYVFDPLVDS